MPLWTALRTRRVALSEDTSVLASGRAGTALPDRCDAPDAHRRPRWLEHALVAASAAFVLWFYAWTIDANTGFDDWGDLDYYRLQVRGWMKGQLHLDKDPAPELLELSDPYDPFQNAPFKLGDATFYRGRYYMYFGAAPAVTLMLPYRILTGREMSTGAATYLLCSAAFLAGAGAWLGLRRRYFPHSALFLAPLGVLAIGFGTHLLALAQRPMFWELAIAGGIAFSSLAVAAVYVALHGRRPVFAMAAAGLFVGLAVGSRPTCLLAAPLLLPPIWLAWRERKSAPASPSHAPVASRASWQALALAAAVPLCLCGAAIMAHNYARYHNPFEFGQHYQLSGAHEGKLTHFSLRFLPHNLRVYFLHALSWEPEFPFAAATKVPVPEISGYFGSEEVSGLAATFPFYWFLLALPLAWWRRESHERRHLSASLATIAGYAMPVMAVVMCYFSTTMRYQADFAVPLAVLSLTGMLALERRLTVAADAGPARRRARTALVLSLATFAAAATVVVGALVMFDYHGRSIFVANYPLWRELSDLKDPVVNRLARWTGEREGPQVLKVRFRARPAGTVETFWTSTDAAAAERIALEHLGDHRIRFGYARGGGAMTWGDELRWRQNHTHTVSVQLPSLYSAPRPDTRQRLRGHDWFRERSAVAVWFSGGRALELVTPPLPNPTVPGGSVSAEFSGDVRKRTTRAFRADELEWGPAAYYPRRGGVLQMRVIFPTTLAAQGEPVFAAGERARYTLLVAQPEAEGLRIVYRNSDEDPVPSEPFAARPGGHLVEIEMPTFRPEAFGWEERGTVIVRVDGREVLRTAQVPAPYLAGTEQFGRNPFGTTCASRFAGWIFDVKWLPPSEPAPAPLRR